MISTERDRKDLLAQGCVVGTATFANLQNRRTYAHYAINSPCCIPSPQVTGNEMIRPSGAPYGFPPEKLPMETASGRPPFRPARLFFAALRDFRRTSLREATNIEQKHVQASEGKGEPRVNGDFTGVRLFVSRNTSRHRDAKESPRVKGDLCFGRSGSVGLTSTKPFAHPL